MRLTTKGRYAVTAMLDLALFSKHGSISLADISARQSISLSYLEQLFAKLRRAHLVCSSRGPGGGYRLGKLAADITVAQVVEAVDESMDATRCEGEHNCQDGEICLTHALWQDLNRHIYQYLSSVTLENLISRQEIHRIGLRQLQAVPLIIQGDS